ncbi:MAG: hypothetical protein E5V25_06380 [Mesorhizobium sp.]|uniref:hypothetical protein n=1 Tax=unclassified Mesorhizobium TaxID=325217 RepID=UPI000FCB85DF|nr:MULTISPECIES: hypothetical protein [unclassified Mesorhizobium]RUV54694.1 hypothetical protein EOA85_23995 [Mesorhizobium sp. M5C.F.Ca.IN.020.29.1.1]RWC23063.1 MAG: hypothetical protein EOS51_08850 [Mesorhizobium sp.]RWD75916.1 MAG: hypothetical protein EOS48_31215 [Mesorhizobium sp.]RWE52685.1 MAG: hypothetical protein EOS67_29645 [Mesorhizobium sp.]RWE92617.1 MAG: hypothetical protein EOS68_25235 [Mesorhizobium sp.]
MEDIIARIRRTSKLGRLGEILAAEALALNGFSGIRDLNGDIHNHPFATFLLKSQANVTSSG